MSSVSNSYKGRYSDLIHHYADFDLSLRRKAHLRRGSSIDSKRNTPVVDFGVERHTLVTEEITQVFHQSSTAVLQDLAEGAHLFRERAQLLRRFSGSTCPIQGEFRDPPLTQLKGRPYTSFAWFLVRFQRRNHQGHILRTLRVRHLERTHSGFPSDHQIRSRETLPTHFTVGQGDQFETLTRRFRQWNH
jgi:hypothetical protein